MPIIRIDPGSGKGKKRQASQQAGSLLASAAAPLSPLAPLIGAYFGDLFGRLISKGEPTFPIEVDTETNTLRLITPDYRAAVNTKTRVLAPKIEARNAAIEAALQSTWNSGIIAPGVPKRYRDEAAELISQRELFGAINAAPPAPTETEGAQYTGADSMAGIVPPGGFAGFAQMTAASKAAQGFGKLMRAAGGRRRKRKAKKSGAKRRKRASGKRKGRKLVKGSAAAKRFMANLRKRRK